LSARFQSASMSPPVRAGLDDVYARRPSWASRSRSLRRTTVSRAGGPRSASGFFLPGERRRTDFLRCFMIVDRAKRVPASPRCNYWNEDYLVGEPIVLAVVDGAVDHHWHRRGQCMLERRPQVLDGADPDALAAERPC